MPLDPDVILPALADEGSRLSRDARDLLIHLLAEVNRLEAELDECAEHRQLHGQVAAALQRMRDAEAANDQGQSELAILRGHNADLQADVRHWAARYQQLKMQTPENDTHDAAYFAPGLGRSR